MYEGSTLGIWIQQSNTLEPFWLGPCFTTPLFYMSPIARSYYMDHYDPVHVLPYTTKKKEGQMARHVENVLLNTMFYVVYVKVLKLTKQKQEEFCNTPPKTHLECVDVGPPCP